MIKNSIFKFLFNVFEASNLVTSICEEHEKIAHKENILVKNKIFRYIDHLTIGLKNCIKEIKEILK